MKISVVIPTYNRAKYLKKTIGSVFAQTYKNFEIIIVDDGSDDDTERVVKSLRSSILYVKQKNFGPGAARNKGVSIAKGDWIAFLDSDDKWFPEKLQIQLKKSMIHDMDVCFHDVAAQISSNTFINSWNEYISKTLNCGPIKTGILNNAFEKIVNASHLFLTSTIFIKKNVYMALCGMNESLRTNQDIEFYFRLAPRVKIGYVNKVLAEYTPGTLRAFEVASKYEKKTARKGKPRVYIDRLESLKLALKDREENNDMKNVQVVKKAIISQMRNLAGEYRKKNMYINAIKIYFALLIFFLNKQFLVKKVRTS